MDQRILLDRLQESDWQALRNRVLYTLVNSSPVRHDPSLCEDIAHEAIKRTLTGRRHIQWPPDGDINDTELIMQQVYSHLCWTARSLISHRSKKDPHTDSLDSSGDEDPSSPANQIPAPGETAVDQVVLKELADRVMKLARTAGNKFIEQVAALLVAYPGITPQEIAEELHADIRDVYNARKWLGRNRWKLEKS